MITLFNITANLLELDDIDNIKLASEILANPIRRTEDPDSTLFEDTILNAPDGSEAKNLIDKMSQLAQLNSLKLSAYWSQIHQPLESTDLHHHGLVDHSWVYYVKVPPGSGNLIFVLDDKDNRCPQCTFTPKEGQCIIFPSYIRHRVSKNMSNDVRISVAGDFSAYK